MPVEARSPGASPTQASERAARAAMERKNRRNRRSRGASCQEVKEAKRMNTLRPSPRATDVPEEFGWFYGRRVVGGLAARSRVWLRRTVGGGRRARRAHRLKE